MAAGWSGDARTPSFPTAGRNFDLSGPAGLQRRKFTVLLLEVVETIVVVLMLRNVLSANLTEPRLIRA
jgi:hypothetical protein